LKFEGQSIKVCLQSEGVMGHWVNVHSPRIHVRLFKQIIVNAFIIMNELDQVGQFWI